MNKTISKMINKLMNITVLLAIVGLLGLFAYSGKAFAVSDQVGGSGGVEAYIAIDSPSNFALSSDGATNAQTLTGNVVWTVTSNDLFTISELGGTATIDGSGTTNGSATVELQRNETDADSAARGDISGGYDQLTTTWGYVVAADEVSTGGSLTWGGGAAPTGTPEKLCDATVATDEGVDTGNFIDYDGSSTITLYGKGVSTATDNAGTYAASVTLTVINQ